MQYDEWRPVIDFTAYDISSQGRVRSWRRKGPGSHMRNQIPFILTPVENKDGYLYVLLYDDDGIRKQGLIHRLILESFVGPCPLGMLTRHLNGKRKDNFLDNLTWGTPLENTQDSIRHGTMSNTSIQSWTKLNYEKVREIKELLNQGIKSSIIAKNYEVSYGTINQIKKDLLGRKRFMNDFIIIDPASVEMNRGSFCYSPYILYSALKAKGLEIMIVEDFSCANLDNLPKAKEYLVALWSYPQIEAALVLNKFLPLKPLFFGYYPLIDHLRLSKYEISDKDILLGIQTYVNYYSDFKFILLSDCDMHLTKYEGLVYPLFTSYGCKNKCKFCPISVNCNSHRAIVETKEVFNILNLCDEKGYKNIHFTDEDFFFDIDRTYEILRFAIGRGFNFISLGSVYTVSKFIKKYGTNIFKASGMRLIEVGLESADPVLNKKMGKGGVDQYQKLAETTQGAVDIFWLTMTFFPGETIGSLRSTGLFLEKYGFKLEDLVNRVRTNSTLGGLGQFFQGYHGAAAFESLGNLGIEINPRPVRLLPSFIPNSFLEDQIKNKRVLVPDEMKWFRLYKIDDELIEYGEKLLAEINFPISVKNILSIFESNTPFSQSDVATYLAISSRIGLIE